MSRIWCRRLVVLCERIVESLARHWRTSTFAAGDGVAARVLVGALARSDEDWADFPWPAGPPPAENLAAAQRLFDADEARRVAALFARPLPPSLCEPIRRGARIQLEIEGRDGRIR